VKELVQWSLEGGTSMLLAYGQTGSGKTYTITGLESLLVDELIRGQASGKKEVKLSIFEVAGSHLFGKKQTSDTRSQFSYVQQIF
jgi:kinesin family protein 2/24